MLKLYARSLRESGVWGTVKRLYQFKDIKFGTHIGTDELGNKYYENFDYPTGQHRWVEPSVFDSGSLTDAALVSPTWHGWLHYTTDDVPGPAKTQTGFKNVSGIDTPYEDHYNTAHTRPWRGNPTARRERGYGVDHHFGKAFENDFYVQPGHPMSPVHKVLGPKIEAWDSAPAPKKDSAKTHAHAKEPWEVFFEQRKQMNKASAGASAGETKTA